MGIINSVRIAMSRQTRKLFFSSDAIFRIVRFVKLYPSFSCKLYLRIIMHMHAIKLHVWACLSISKLYEMNVGRLVQFCAVPTRSPIFNSMYSNSAFCDQLNEFLKNLQGINIVWELLVRVFLDENHVNPSLSIEWVSVFIVCLFFTRGQFWHSGIVVACVCLCVYCCFYLFIYFFCLLISFLFFFFWGGGADWLWPSKSNFTSKSKFTPFWACPSNNSSPVPARIPK